MRLLGKTWISSENSTPQNILGIFLAVPLVIIAVITAALLIPFNRPSKLSASEVRAYLKDFLDDTGGAWGWDDFISVEIEDPKLEAIRQRAVNIELPLDEEGAVAIRQLLTEVEGLCANPSDPK